MKCIDTLHIGVSYYLRVCHRLCVCIRVEYVQTSARIRFYGKTTLFRVYKCCS